MVRSRAFFHFDPLLALTTLIASREFLKVFLWALIPVILTFLFGRYVCGWVCPFGAVLQFFSYLFKKMKWHAPKLAGNRLLYLKYAILVVVLAAMHFHIGSCRLPGSPLLPVSFFYCGRAAGICDRRRCNRIRSPGHRNDCAWRQPWRDSAKSDNQQNIPSGTAHRIDFSGNHSSESVSRTFLVPLSMPCRSTARSAGTMEPGKSQSR